MNKLLTASFAAIAVAAFNNAIGADTCEVVMIEGADGNPARINKSAYDANPDGFKLYEPSGKKAKEEVEAATAPQQTAQPDGNFKPVQSTAGVNPNPAPYAVTSDGKGASKRAYIVHSDTGKRVENMTGVDPAGYADEAKAWEAILALQPSQSTNLPPLVAS